MSYFKENYSKFLYPLKEGDEESGFRKSQLGAIHSAAGHLSIRSEPAIITMPTGSGKTAVLISCAFIQRASRVLVITPSRLVREQIADEFKQLKILKKTGALPSDIPSPKVFSTTKRITTHQQWEDLREFDVVVATIQSISPEYQEIPEPPADLFDLVLVDEAHHSPARTWQSVLEHFNSAKRLLFTATPFRQDQKEIKAKFIFNYDLRDAFKDRIFGEILFQPVTTTDTENHDEAIARAAEKQFLIDKKNNFYHRLMVRTDSRKRAKELFDIYSSATNLRLEIITGNTALRTVKRTITKLDNDQLDGIVCVNMLGEGFDFPSLKIAAIHSPHKSLGVTLQFVGRFARTSGKNLGQATFLAIPSDIQIEAEKLYDTSAVWQEIIHNLSASRVSQEIQIRESVQSFESFDSIPDLEDLSLYSLQPYYHVKIYKIQGDIDISKEILFPEDFQVIYTAYSHQLNVSIFITREITQPRWTTDSRLSNIKNDLFIFYYDSNTKLLFLCATRRSKGIYDELMESFNNGEPSPLPLFRLNRALNDLTSTEFFNVGMRSRVTSNESYRILSGPSADKSVLKSDGRLFHRGHVFGRAKDNNEMITIGLSSASKIWSNTSSKLPDLIEWCKKLASRINSTRIPITNSGLDYLDPGEELIDFPNNIIAARWPIVVYKNPPIIHYVNHTGTQVSANLLDFTLNLNIEESKENFYLLEAASDDITFRFIYSFETNRFFEPATDDEPEILVEYDRRNIPIIEYINNEMISFYTNDFSHIEGVNIFRSSKEPIPPFDDNLIQVLDWKALNVNIQNEFENKEDGYLSIHEYLLESLKVSTEEIVYYDHGTGEIADFVSITRIDGKVNISFYHCKKSKSTEPGHRIDALDTLLMQTVQSSVWTSKNKILANIKRRYKLRKGSHQFIRGSVELMEEILDSISEAFIEYEFIAVQPGLKKANMPLELSNMLAATSDFLIRSNYKHMRIWAS